LYDSVRLGVYRTKRDDIKKYNRPVLLGEGMAEAFSKAFDAGDFAAENMLQAAATCCL
jgi:hypothetical protein